MGDRRTDRHLHRPEARSASDGRSSTAARGAAGPRSFSICGRSIDEAATVSQSMTSAGRGWASNMRPSAEIWSTRVRAVETGIFCRGPGRGFGPADILINSAAIFENRCTRSRKRRPRHPGTATVLDQRPPGSASSCQPRSAFARASSRPEWRETSTEHHRLGGERIPFRGGQPTLVCARRELAALAQLQALELGPGSGSAATTPRAILPPPGFSRGGVRALAGRIQVQPESAVRATLQTPEVEFLLTNDFVNGEEFFMSRAGNNCRSPRR